LTERKRIKIVFSAVSAVLLLAAVFGLSACSGASPEKTSLRVLCAGSLMVPLDEMEKAFESSRPGIDVLTEGHGSIQVIRHVTELYEEADVITVADDSLIPMMMYNAKVPETDVSYADWHIKYATNSLGIAYTPSSKYAAEVSADSWYEVLSRPDIRVGFADARLDACGYYTLMMLSLAELYYGQDSILEDVLGDFNPPLKTETAGAVTVVVVPEILRPDSEKTVVRSSSIRLLALLESGDIDYSFEYQSVARQHNLDFVSLPAEINLGDAALSDFYGRVKVRLDFQRFTSITPEFTGQPIVYGITIPRNAPHPEAAREYLEFLLGTEGQKIFKDSFHPLLTPVVDNPGNLPSALRDLLDVLTP
jgi:molybdate/tungstate transport system substrate-binding protein